MIIDRTHFRWGVATAIASGVTGFLYLANNHPDTLKKWGVGIDLPAFLGPVPPLEGNVGATPLGVFRSVERPVYDEGVAEQIRVARERSGEGDLEALLHAGDTWQIG